MTNDKTAKRSSRKYQNELEDKLQRSVKEANTAREEMQASQEELNTAHEELQSSNEELQLTNEELTTSKEEMQSLNEELHAINMELQSKVNDLIHTRDDMKNLLNSTEIATLFLDKELNVRWFTDTVSSIIKLRSSDIGRPFTDLSNDLQYPTMETDALYVMKTLISTETLTTTNDGRWFNVRIMPYRTLDDYIDGLVITFSDKSKATNLEIELTNINKALLIKEKAFVESELRYRSIFVSAKDGILILDAESGKIMDVNPFLIDLLGYSKEQLIEKTIWEIGLFKDIVASHDKFLELQQKEFVRYENLPLETADKRIIHAEFISNVYSVADNKVIQCIIRN